MEDSEKKTIQDVLSSGAVVPYDIQKKIQDGLYRPSEQVLATRNQIRQGTQEYNRMNQFVALATGRRPGPPMKDPTFNDGITKSQITSAKESALIQFARSLEKIREELGRDIKQSEVYSIAKAYNIGPEGLEKIFGGKFFDYVGITPEKERLKIQFDQSQKDRADKIAADNAKIKENENIDLVVSRASRMFREAQQNGVLTYNKQQEILYDATRQAEMLGIDPATVIKRAKDLLLKPPTTKQVIDTNTGQAVLISDNEIANNPNRYIPILNDSGKLSTKAENAAILAFGKAGMEYNEGLELVRLMEDLSPLVAMEKYPEKREFIMKILQNMQISDPYLDLMMKGDAGSNILRFE